MKKGLRKIGVVLLTVLTLSACSTSEGANENTSTEKLESQTSETSTVISSSLSEEVAESSSSEEVIESSSMTIESSSEIVEMSNEEINRRIDEAAEKIKAQYDENSYDMSVKHIEDDVFGDGAIYITYKTPFINDMVWNAKHKDPSAFQDYKLLKKSFWEMFCNDLYPTTRIVFKFGEGSMAEFESTVDKSRGLDIIEKYYYGFYD